jgi:N,N'-diacetyllegionaminate synthase
MSETIYSSTSESIPFGSRRIGPTFPVVIIAEIGVNHEGDVDQCGEMIRHAASSGADAIKLQSIDADKNYVPGTESHAIFSQCELSPSDTEHMFVLANELGMEAFTTSGDPETLEWVEALNPAAHKISSGLLTHIPMVERTAQTGRTMLISTGMAKATEIDDAVSIARASGCQDIGMFQCTSQYPAPVETLNLATMRWLEERYGLSVGFSDHSIGTGAAALAVAAGAHMIEKHFTFDKSRPGFDHKISLEKDEMADMVAAIRSAERAIGSPEKQLAQAEQANRLKFHRCLVACRDIRRGEVFSEENLWPKRPLPDNRGLAAKHYGDVIGRRATADIAKNEPVTAKVVEDFQ